MKPNLKIEEILGKELSLIRPDEEHEERDKFLVSAGRFDITITLPESDRTRQTQTFLG